MMPGKDAVATSPNASPEAKRRSSLHRHLMQWMERKVNRNIVRNPFEQQEREARRRGAPLDAKAVPERKREEDVLSALLRTEHKVQPAGRCILRLPRLPFGCHRTYNEEDSFTEQHLVTTCVSPTQAGELEALSKLYRLAEKRKAKKTKYASPHKSPKKKEVDSVESDTGTLYFPRQERMLKAYETDKERYSKALALTVRLPTDTYSPTSHHRGRSLLSPTRLYPGRRLERECRLSEPLAHKFSKLFDALCVQDTESPESPRNVCEIPPKNSVREYNKTV